MNGRWEWLPLAGFGLSHYAVIVALGLLAYAIGLKLAGRCRYHSTLERVAFCTTLGLGALSYLVFALGLVGALSRGPAIALLAVLVLSCRTEWRRIWAEATGVRRRSGLWGGILIVAAAGVLLPFFLLPLYPPTHWDATLYHLALAKRYVAAHWLAFFPEVRFALFPQLNEMLFALLLLLADDVTAQLVQFLMTALLAMGLWAWGQRMFSVRAGAWAVALLLANPIVIWLGSSAYIDIGVTLFGVLACYGYWNWLETRQREWLVLCGVFCGLAAASKYSALFWLGLLALLTVYHWLRRRAPGRALAVLALGALVGVPWYIRNAYYSGNPIFPFFPQLFGQRYWTLGDIRAMLFDVGRSYGVGRTWSGLVSLPWHLAFNQDMFHSERHFTVAYLFLLPIVALAAVRRPAVRWLSALAAASTVWWYYAGQELRYLVPTLPLYSLAAVAALDGLAQRLPIGRRPFLQHGIAVAVGALLLLPGWQYAMIRVRAQGPVPVTAAERDTFLTRALPAYPAYKFLNARRGPRYTVYAVYNENMAYFADGKFEGDWFGPARYSRVLSRIGSSQDLYAELRGLGADYFLINDWRRVSLPIDRFFYTHFQPVFMTGSTWLFELVPPSPAGAGEGPQPQVAHTRFSPW